MSILSELKELVEIDLDEEIYDKQLLLYCNMGLRYLHNDAIPVSRIDEDTEWLEFGELREGDELIVIDWLHLYVVQRFDKALLTVPARGTMVWIDTEMTNLLYQLKTLYDQGET